MSLAIWRALATLLMNLTGNSISWYRSEALMYRWLEEFESKHAELDRYILNRRNMANLWTRSVTEQASDESIARQFQGKDVSDNPPSNHVQRAFRARGMRQAATLHDLAHASREAFKEVAHPGFFEPDTHLAVAVDAFRGEQLKWMEELDIVRADLVRGLHF